MSDRLPLVDLSYLLDISGNDTSYVAEVTGIFIDTMTTGLPLLLQLAQDATDYDQIHKQAHFLKSSAGIIKVRENYEHLVKINAMSLQKAGITEIQDLVAQICENFEEAREELTNIRNSGGDS